MKPDWKDAPDWAKYLAMDGNHEWFWYENEPSKENRYWAEPRGRIRFANNDGINWEESLEKRPEENDD